MPDAQRPETDNDRRRPIIVVLLAVICANAALLTSLQTESTLLRVVAGSCAIATGIAAVAVAVRSYRNRR